MKIPISNKILDEFILKNHEYLLNKEYYDLKYGVQEYRLYSYLLNVPIYNITILDIGTFDGRSAISLSHNENNKVISYDIIDYHIIYTKKILILILKMFLMI